MVVPNVRLSVGGLIVVPNGKTNASAGIIFKGIVIVLVESQRREGLPGISGNLKTGGIPLETVDGMGQAV